MPTPDVQGLLAESAGIRLDIGCGANKQDGFVGIDMQPLPGVDIIWDVNIHPWPLPDECALVAMCSHLVEHIPPCIVTAEGTRWPFLEFMDEVWRLLKPNGEFIDRSANSSGQFVSGAIPKQRKASLSLAVWLRMGRRNLFESS